MTRTTDTATHWVHHAQMHGRLGQTVLRLHQLVIRPHEERLARRAGAAAAAVWREVADTVSSKIYGPHFEDLARQWCAEHASPRSLGGPASRVRPAEIACPRHRTSHELDVVVTTTSSGAADRIAAIGDSPPRLLLFASNGFTREVVEASRSRGDVELIDLDRLYQGR